MNRSSRNQATLSNLSESTQRLLNSYALAASAAGVSALALAMPAEAWEPSPSFQRSGYLLTIAIPNFSTIVVPSSSTIVIPNFLTFVIPSEARNLQLSESRENAAGLVPSVPLSSGATLQAPTANADRMNEGSSR